MSSEVCLLVNLFEKPVHSAIRHFSCLGDNLHAMLNLILWEKSEKIFQNVVLLKFLPNMLSVKVVLPVGNIIP